jgi:hypothetical protein
LGKPKSQNDEELSGDDESGSLTAEENLLAALLTANEALLEALRVHDDLERVALEQQAEEWSKKETRIDYVVSRSLLPV